MTPQVSNTSEISQQNPDTQKKAKIKGMWARLKSSPMLRNTGLMVVGQGGNFFLQAAYFFLLARLLGVSEYGVYAGAFALVNTFMPYTSLGSQMIFMRYVSVDRSQATKYWGNTLAITLACSLLCALLLSLFANKVLGAGNVGLILVLVVANCWAAQITLNASVVFQTFERFRMTSWLSMISNLLRTLAVGILLLWLHHVSAFQCALGLLAASSVAALIANSYVRRTIGKTHLSLQLLRRRFLEGIGFSVAGSTQSLYNDADKIMLAHYGAHAVTGIYTLAYRVADFSTTPVAAFNSASLPKMFALNHAGQGAVFSFTKKAIPIAVLAGLGAAVCTLCASPYLVWFAGKGFAGAIEAIRWLCWLPALRAIHQFAGTALTTTGRQNSRTVAQLVVAILNVVLNIIWIPSHGWLGAAWASLISDGSLGALNLALMVILFKRNPPAMQSA